MSATLNNTLIVRSMVAAVAACAILVAPAEVKASEAAPIDAAAKDVSFYLADRARNATAAPCRFVAKVWVTSTSTGGIGGHSFFKLKEHR